MVLIGVGTLDAHGAGEVLTQRTILDLLDEHGVLVRKGLEALVLEVVGGEDRSAELEGVGVTATW